MKGGRECLLSTQIPDPSVFLNGRVRWPSELITLNIQTAGDTLVRAFNFISAYCREHAHVKLSTRTLIGWRAVHLAWHYVTCTIVDVFIYNGHGLWWTGGFFHSYIPLHFFKKCIIYVLRQRAIPLRTNAYTWTCQ